MKIAIATTTGFHLRRIAESLQRTDADFTYFSTMPRFRMRRDRLEEARTVSLFGPLLPISAGALLRQVPAIQNRCVPAMRARTDRYLARHLPPCDVFIGISAMAVACADVARRRYGATVVIERGSRHVLSQNELVREGGGAPLSADYIERELASYAAADFISVLSNHSAMSFIERGFPPDRLFVNPLGVDLSTFRTTPRPAGPLKLLFVGQWSRRKGADILAEALRRRPDWHLSHAGTTLDLALPALPHFTSLGHQPHGALARLMGEHHILVLPSREDGFGMVLLEALAGGLGVVASTMTGGPDIRERLDDSSAIELCAPGDVDDLLRALDLMAAREAAGGTLRQRLSDADRATFGWAGYGARYVDFLNRIAAQRGQSPIRFKEEQER